MGFRKLGMKNMKAAHPLQIVAARYWRVAMPFKQALEWTSGARPATNRIVVEITLANGVVGFGETICLLDFIEPVLAKAVLPIAMQHRADDVEKFHRHILGAGYYHHKRAVVMAEAAVEMAMWDARGKSMGQPIWSLLGGAFRKEIEVAAYLFGTDPAKLDTAAQRFLDLGYSSFKVKIGMSEGSDLRNVETVRRRVGNLHLRADVNGAWTPGTARRQLAKLLPYDLQYVEQPLELDDLIGHAELRRTQLVPIALDESAYTLADVSNIVRMGAADVILLDPHEIGGIWQTVKAAAIAEAAGIPVTLHSGGELGLSQSAYIHLAASIPNMSVSIDSERDYLHDDVVTLPPVIKDGCFQLPQTPGIGVNIDFEALSKYRVDTIEGAYLDSSKPGWFSVKPAY